MLSPPSLSHAQLKVPCGKAQVVMRLYTNSPSSLFRIIANTFIHHFFSYRDRVYTWFEALPYKIDSLLILHYIPYAIARYDHKFVFSCDGMPYNIRFSGDHLFCFWDRSIFCMCKMPQTTYNQTQSERVPAVDCCSTVGYVCTLGRPGSLIS